MIGQRPGLFLKLVIQGYIGLPYWGKDRFVALPLRQIDVHRHFELTHDLLQDALFLVDRENKSCKGGNTQFVNQWKPRRWSANLLPLLKTTVPSH